VNADPAVQEVVHVGDIHSGSQRCAQAYDQSIYDKWTQYTKPLVYTPGDNEWSDCQKPKEISGNSPDPSQADPSLSYANANPVENLALVRQIFFAHPGQALGSGKLQIESQAQQLDPHMASTDGNYVENVMWAQDHILFVTVNIPGGSNNDADAWYGNPITAQQSEEIAERTQADLDWIDRAYQKAQAPDIAGLVIITQADMWDVADTLGPAHQTNYEPFISEIAHQTLQFGRPVLMFNGDSHLYRSDDPLMQGSPCAGEATSDAPETACAKDAWLQHPNPFYALTNFHRVVVHGSMFNLEYLRLTVDPNANNPTTSTSFGPFSWERVQPTLP
jgi:hypothetical protein